MRIYKVCNDLLNKYKKIIIKHQIIVEKKNKGIARLGEIVRNTEIPDSKYRYFQELAHNIAYRSLSYNEKLPGINTTYTVNQIFLNMEGLVCFALKSANKTEKSILLIRGTNSFIHLKEDITAKDLGKAPALNSEEQITQWVKQQKSDILITGHSLGGAIAQHLGCMLAKNPAITKKIEVITFNSLAPGKNLLKDFSTISDEKKTEVVHFRNEGDISYTVGFSELIPGKLITIKLPFKTSRRDAHSIKSFQVKGYTLDESPPTKIYKKRVIEIFMAFIRSILRLMIKLLPIHRKINKEVVFVSYANESCQHGFCC